MTADIRAEIKANFAKFEDAWPKELNAAKAAIVPARAQFEHSFLRISSIQAWRTGVVNSAVSADAAAFFFEAQNDLLTSHCLASCGSFRQALKALRSALENIYFSMYYKDHPVEFAKWEQGSHKLGFKELSTYLEGHPDLAGVPAPLTGLPVLQNEYSTLSKAVHGSAKQFRMTNNLEDIRLWAGDTIAVSQWATRERLLIQSLNLLLLSLFREHLAGAKLLGLRQVVGAVIPKNRHPEIKTALGITLIAP
jgi:hypothetical protein